MSEPGANRAVLLCHGTLADGLMDAVRHITGCAPDAVVPITNRGKSPEALATEVTEALGTGPAIIFTDLQSGSCGFVARRLAQSKAQLVVISGVNLPVLIEFVMNSSLPLDQIVPRLLAKGRAAMGCAPSHFEEHADRSASGR
jgi:mannose PTS system EIIA component